MEISTRSKVILACPRVPEAVALAAGRLRAVEADDIAAHTLSCRACKTTLRMCEDAVRSGRLPAAFRASVPGGFRAESRADRERHREQ